MDISHISVSRKDTHDTCPQKYKYQYHLKTPKTEDEPFYFIYGKIIHRIAEEYVKAKGDVPLKEITRQVTSGELFLEEYKGETTYAPAIPPDYKKRMPGMLRSIETLTQRIGFEGDTEWEFRLDLDPPNERFAVGIVDRLIQKDDKFFILDYKTTKRGKFRKDSKTILYDLQMRSYARVIQKTFDCRADQIRAGLYYLEGGNLVAATFSQKSLLAAEEELLEAHKQISASDPDKVWGKVGPHCSRCDWQRICPFYRSKSFSIGHSDLPDGLR